MEVEKELNQVLVAREFADIFKPVTELPAKRATEFRIDLVPRAEPINRLPSRMTPTEMK